jgi:hypothetical protein
MEPRLVRVAQGSGTRFCQCQCQWPHASEPAVQGTEPPMGTGDGDDPRSPANRGCRWGWTPDPRQIGDRGWGCSGPPIVGACQTASAEQLHLMGTGSRMSPRLALVAVIARGRRARRRHNDIRFRFRMLMLSTGLMLQCQLTSLIAAQTPIDVHSGDEGAHPKPACSEGR